MPKYLIADGKKFVKTGEIRLPKAGEWYKVKGCRPLLTTLDHSNAFSRGYEILREVSE